MQLGARNANYLQARTSNDAPKCGQMHRLAASPYAYLYAQPLRRAGGCVDRASGGIVAVRARQDIWAKRSLPGRASPN